MPTLPSHADETQVWDRPVRLFHWLLVLAVGTAAVTGFFAGAPWLRWHITGGLVAAALVLMRIVWGFLGSPPARFTDFVPGPHAVVDHLQGRGHRYLGHNPLGALMVLALIAGVLVLALTGLGLLGGLLRTGPLAADLGTSAGLALREGHEVIAFLLVGLVALHLLGVGFESWRTRENLARSMVTGMKRRRAGDVPTRPARARGLVALAVIAAIGAGLTAANAALSARQVPGLPTAEIQLVTAEECGACHMVYHPALLPAARWTEIMATLEDHFGEDASLDPVTTAEIETWLAANAAETVDTKPARLFARAPDGARGITDQPAWERLHAELTDALFASRAVGARSNCVACHADAETGRFSPFAISIPKETPQ